MKSKMVTKSVVADTEPKADPREQREWIDVRGPHPIYFHGMRATELTDVRRGVGLNFARSYAEMDRANAANAE